jgi:hypothetical protein
MNAFGDGSAGVTGMPSRPLQCDSGYIDSGHSPAARGQPDGVGTFSRTHIQRRARGECIDLCNQVRVGVPAPQRGLRAVALVPERLVELFGHGGLLRVGKWGVV